MVSLRNCSHTDARGSSIGSPHVSASRCPAVQIRERNVGRQAQRAGEAAVLKMMRALRHCGLGFRPTAHRIAAHDNAWRSFERFDEAKELCRTEHAAVLLEP